MVGAALRRAIVGATFMLLGSACASILGDFKLETDACVAGQDACCPDGVAEGDACTKGNQSCTEGCDGTDGCNASTRCIEAITSSDTGGLCPDSPAQDAFVELKECLCGGDCQSDCQSTLCSGALPLSLECRTCSLRSSDCRDEYQDCATE